MNENTLPVDPKMAAKILGHMAKGRPKNFAPDELKRRSDHMRRVNIQRKTVPR